MDYLDEVRILKDQIRRIDAEIDRQVEQLEPFITGRRRSVHPLGKKLILNVAHMIDDLKADIEGWFRDGK